MPKEVDIDGLKITLPDEQADELIKRRQAAKDEQRKLQERVGALDREKAEAERKAQEAADRAAALEAAKKGDAESAERLFTKRMTEEREKLGAKLRDRSLAAVVTKHPKILTSAADDIAEQLRGRTRYDFESDSLIVIDPAGQPVRDDSGKPVPADAWLGQWLEKRPHYLRDSTPPGSGAGDGHKPVTGPVWSADQLEKASPLERANFFAQGGKLAS